MEFILREYQQQLVDDILENIEQGNKKICVVLPCGGGKSVVQGSFALAEIIKNKRVLFLIHRGELKKQIKDTFTNLGVDLLKCELAMVQSYTRKLDQINLYEDPDVIITDETHHSVATTYKRIYNTFPNAIKIGFTATPIRSDGKGLKDVYNKMITSVSVRWLIENKYLADYNYYSIKLVDTSKLKVSKAKGEYTQKSLTKLMESKVIYGSAINEWRKLASDKKTIVYCSTCKASEDLVQEFKYCGIKAEHIDGKTPKKQRERLVEQFRNGEIQVLSNVDLFGEGFDVPTCECVLLLRPTKSLGLYIQQSMRGMRYVEGKTSIIIDLVANLYEHNLPDFEHEWTLEDLKVDKQKNKELEELVCPNCNLVNTNDVAQCGTCKYYYYKICPDCKEKEYGADDICSTCGYVYYRECGHCSKVNNTEDIEIVEKTKKVVYNGTLCDIPIQEWKCNFCNKTNEILGDTPCEEMGEREQLQVVEAVIEQIECNDDLKNEIFYRNKANTSLATKVEQLAIFKSRYSYKKGWIYEQAKANGLITNCSVLWEIQTVEDYLRGWVYHRCEELKLKYSPKEE